MLPTIVRWMLRVGLGSLLLLALPLFPLTIPVSFAGPAAEKADLLDINTATAGMLEYGYQIPLHFKYGFGGVFNIAKGVAGIIPFAMGIGIAAIH